MERGERARRIHFIGIGGSSLSGLASMALDAGHRVSGSDRAGGHKTDALAARGAEVIIGHAPERVRGADLVVYSAAIPKGDPELAYAAASGIPVMGRAEYLGRLMGACEESICVSGTHGKTTASAMAATVFIAAGEDPTVHIGGELPSIGGGSLRGGDRYFIAEACEFDRSFLKMRPTAVAILNIDFDHPDTYLDLDETEAAFLAFARMTPKGGFVAGWGDDPRVTRVLAACGRDTRTFGLGPSCELRAEGLSEDGAGGIRFEATLFGHPLAEVSLPVPGEHNVIDALAALALADRFELSASGAAEALASFTGVKRRFERTSVTDGAAVYQDYAHNPAEIRCALSNARKATGGRVIAVWQPHTYSRTKRLFEDFLGCFGEADELLVTDICGAREADPGDIHSADLVGALRARGIPARLTPSFDDAEAALRGVWRAGDLAITLGCGDIDRLNDRIAERGDTVSFIM